MPGKHLYEYAVIRFVPKVEREEFLNTGIILFCKRPAFLGVRMLLDMDRLLRFSPDTDIEALHCHLAAFEKIALGTADSGPIGRLDHASRFRWLTATRSTIIQPSKVHVGYSDNLEETLEKLFRTLVC